MTERYIKSEPYKWPYNGDLQPGNTALIIIDMQTDFCGVGGYVDKMGYDLSLTRAPIEPIKRVLATFRRKRLPHHPYPRRSSARSVGSAGQQTLAIAPDRRRHRRSRPVRPNSCARRAGLGHYSRTCAASPANRSSTSPAKARSARPIWSCYCGYATSTTSFSPG